MRMTFPGRLFILFQIQREFKILSQVETELTPKFLSPKSQIFPGMSNNDVESRVKRAMTQLGGRHFFPWCSSRMSLSQQDTQIFVSMRPASVSQDKRCQIVIWSQAICVSPKLILFALPIDYVFYSRPVNDYSSDVVVSSSSKGFICNLESKPLIEWNSC